MTDHAYKDLGEVIKSPLDTNKYKVIKLCPNGFQAVLVSTSCGNPTETQEIDKKTCAFKSIQEFNEKYLEIPKEKTLNQDEENGNTRAQNPSTNKRNKKMATIKSLKCFKRRSEVNGDRVTGVLAIGSGMLNDPIEISGLAHLTEHCIFFGSKKYPKLEYFTSFCQKYGGDANAGTNAEVTTFFFSLENANHLEEALDILADAVFNPLFPRVDSEIESLNSEFHTKKLTDEDQYMDILLSFFNPEHPLGRYGLGSRATLTLGKNRNLTKIMNDWKEENYVPNNMVVSIDAPLPIEKMTDMVVRKFGTEATGCGCTELSPRKKLYSQFKSMKLRINCEWNTMTYIIPMAHGQWIKLAWALESHPVGIGDYRTKPLAFLTFLLTSKEKGGLELYLRNKGWIISLDTSCSPHTPNWGFFTTLFCTIFIITLNLTHEGLLHRRDVIKAVFSYLKMLKKSKKCDLERVFNEMRQISADVFHYRSDSNILEADPINKIDASETDSILSELAQSLMNEVDPKEILMSQFVTRKFDFELINGYIQSLTPAEANFVVAAAMFESKCTEVKTPLRTKYLSEKIDRKFITELENASVYSELRLPPPNDFIHRSLCYPINPGERLEQKKDIVIVKNDLISVNYSNSDCKTGHLPTAFYAMTMASPLVLNPFAYGVIPNMKIWTDCLSYIVDVKIASALQALVTLDIFFDEESNNQLICNVTGPSHGLPEIFDLLFTSIVNFETEIKEWMFENMVETNIDVYDDIISNSETFAEDLKTSVITQKRLLSSDHIEFLISKRTFSKDLRILPKYIDTIFEEFIEFVGTFKEHLFVSITLSGCISKSHAEQIASTVKMLTSSPWTFTRDMVMINRAIKLPLGERCLRVRSNNKLDNNNFVENHYQVGIAVDKIETILLAMLQSMHNAAFENLRINQRIGYFVNVDANYYHSVMGITIQISAPADQFTTQFMDEKVDDFLAEYFKNILSKRGSYMENIEKQFRGEDEISWAEVKTFYQNYLLPNGSNFRKLSVQIVGYPEDPKLKPKQGQRLTKLIKQYSSTIPFGGNKDDPLFNYTLDLPTNVKCQNGYFITHLVKFKNAQTCYPNLISYEDLMEK